MSIALVVVYNIHSELSYLYANMSTYLTFPNEYVYTVPFKGKFFFFNSKISSMYSLMDTLFIFYLFYELLYL